MAYGLTKQSKPVDKWLSILLFIIMMVILITAAAFWSINRMTFALVTLAMPVIILLISYPRAIPYLYTVSLTIFWVPISGTAYFLADYMALLLLGSVVLDILLRNRRSLVFPSIGGNYIVLISALIFTGVFAMNPWNSTGPILRAMLQLVTICLICNTIKKDDIQKLVILYFWIMFAQSLFNLTAFLNLGGAYRVFGLANVYFDDLVMLAAPIGFSYFLWSKPRSKSLKYGLAVLVIVLGVISTHSRLPLITIILIGLFMSVLALYKTRKSNYSYIRGRLVVMVLAVLSMSVVTIVYADIFHYAFERFVNLVTHTYTGSVATRLSLWSAGFKAFINNPLTGIGPGNFRFIDLAFPELKFDAARIWVKGYSAHNLFIHYLAETGIIGTVAIISVYFHNLKAAWKVLRHSHSDFPESLCWALYGVGLTIAVTIFYMDGWMWGLVACAAPFFFALTSKTLSCDRDYE